ncbi:glutathione binding-like protein [Kozakia baliensis]|uniref:Glutathione S-transferase n=1 Tax=Kozakia baliensis TaxID=153496 RepID=A0A1D8UR85_9PROT|nr:glutathione binding-like protein [Kozakia baliensis]AOX16144.1 glutathione S-transferase [Kozakia baliensis]GBR23355.1 glutathione S-transferase [Kozakia baliensis NRIC 0488]GEL65030.1 glutathione S-transferase [Kozakia baliensis]
MKLYYAKGACSLASHIVLNEAGLPYSLDRVDLKNKKTSDGHDYLKINPRGAVPALEISPGTVLTQNIAVLSYIGDQSNIAAFRPAPNSLDRYRLLEAIGFCEDVHAAIAPLFVSDLPEIAHPKILANVERRLKQLEEILSKSTQNHLLPTGFTQADALIAVIFNWTTPLKIDVSNYPRARALHEEVFARDATVKALKSEGLA